MAITPTGALPPRPATVLLASNNGAGAGLAQGPVPATVAPSLITSDSDTAKSITAQQGLLKPSIKISTSLAGLKSYDSYKNLWPAYAYYDLMTSLTNSSIIPPFQKAFNAYKTTGKGSGNLWTVASAVPTLIWNLKGVEGLGRFIHDSGHYLSITQILPERYRNNYGIYSYKCDQTSGANSNQFTSTPMTSPWEALSQFTMDHHQGGFVAGKQGAEILIITDPKVAAYIYAGGVNATQALARRYENDLWLGKGSLFDFIPYYCFKKRGGDYYAESGKYDKKAIFSLDLDVYSEALSNQGYPVKPRDISGLMKKSIWMSGALWSNVNSLVHGELNAKPISLFSVKVPVVGNANVLWPNIGIKLKPDHVATTYDFGFQNDDRSNTVRFSLEKPSLGNTSAPNTCAVGMTHQIGRAHV